MKRRMPDTQSGGSKEIRVDLTEPGALYDYLVEYAAPEGVQEDEL